jgi:hypothetical protein
MSGAARPAHEVGGPGAERRQDERYGQKDGACAHGRAFALGITASVAGFLAAATGATPPSARLASTLVIWGEAKLFCAFCTLRRCATDVMGWDGGL